MIFYTILWAVFNSKVKIPHKSLKTFEKTQTLLKGENMKKTFKKMEKSFLVSGFLSLDNLKYIPVLSKMQAFSTKFFSFGYKHKF